MKKLTRERVVPTISAGLRHMAQVAMRDLVREDPAKLIVIGSLKQAGRHVHLAAARVRGIGSGDHPGYQLAPRRLGAGGSYAE